MRNFRKIRNTRRASRLSESRRSSKGSGSILEKIKDVLESMDMPEDEMKSEKCDKPKRKKRVRAVAKESRRAKVRESARRRSRKTLIKECHKPKRKTLIKESHKPRRSVKRKMFNESRRASSPNKITLEESKNILRLRRLAGM